ncbi:hypothetical protein N7508_007665 [Penicillium antarcticum]|uniref:uncharacterized protein n=1 Tax=Penicillium antarcticum TaxID=416450 RepID=UPI00239F54B0|nr:uncharacterized protein N7508_007665 [Penicillium antarcticum]KAJ5297416.1 hypothetical protein N7508_007665 [Penicillium antarcticum]
MDPEQDVVYESLFRPAKKRKFTRRRPDHETPEASDADLASSPANQNNLGPDRQSQDDAPSTTKTAATRRLRPVRKGGIGFSTTSRVGDEQTRKQALGPVSGDPDQEKIQAMNERFTGYTGQTVDVDRHMMAYIDSEMAKRYQPELQAENADASQSNHEQTAGGLSVSGHKQREPASLGKLHEIDLGQEATLRNIARTEAATRKLAGDEDEPAPGETTAPGTCRSGPDGKPWRNRKQRADADIERDRLVEEVLRESKLDVYDDPEDETQFDDQAADDRIAEQFRRDFMDAIQTRRRTAKPAPKVAEGPRGPKLGGSRSARAAMRETQTKPGHK